MNKLIKIIGNILFYIILAFFITIIISTFNAKRLGKVPNVLGYKVLNVLTGSMSPTFDEGSLIVIKETEENNINVGDVITFNFDNSNSITTHRVVEIIEGEEGKEFVTRGDANNANDPNTIKYRNVEGVVMFSIPKLGQILGFIGENIIVTIVLALGIILLIYILFSLLIKVKCTV